MMDLFYVLIVLVSGLGIFLGYALGRISPEELVPLKDQYHTLKEMVYWACLPLLFALFPVVNAVILALFLAANLLIPTKFREQYRFIVLGISVGLSSSSAYLLLPILVLVYGTLTGLLWRQKKKSLQEYAILVVMYVLGAILPWSIF